MRRAALRDEHGSILVLTALLLPMLLLFLVFVIDVGNWWVHDRHLQTQADAAALAAAGSVTYPCDSAAAQAVGLRYGDEPYNAQVGGTHKGTIDLRFNSATYADGTAGSADDPTGDICSTGTVDVKATESNVPLFFGRVFPGLSVVPAINAHARAELRKLQSMIGQLPLGIPDTNFHYLFAQFVQTGTTTPVAGCADACTVELVHVADGSDRTLWTNASPISLPVSTAGISVRIGVVYAKAKNLSCTAPGVTCFDDLNYVRGYPTGNPALHDVKLLPGTCSDGYFTSGSCTIGIRAVLDLGSKAQSGTGITMSVTASAGGKSQKLDPVNPSPGTGEQAWTAPDGLALGGLGANDVTVSWSWSSTSGVGCSKKNPCTASGSSVVHRSYLADDGFPLLQVGLGTVPGGVGSNSFAQGSTPGLYVTVGVVDNVKAAADSSDPTVLLRFSSGTGSGNQAIDCDRNTTLRDEIVTGCVTPYQVNVTSTCPNADDPASCVPIETGDKRGQIKQGMNDRFAQCPANNWRKGVAGWTPAEIAPDDPRLVTLMIVPWAAFDVSGTKMLPILEFAKFYVTGWDGGACGDNEPYPGHGSPHGDVWGHFYAYRGQVPGGTPGEAMCDLGSRDPEICIPVLTR